jgi:hypothetical protein
MHFGATPCFFNGRASTIASRPWRCDDLDDFVEHIAVLVDGAPRNAYQASHCHSVADYIQTD